MFFKMKKRIWGNKSLMLTIDSCLSAFQSRFYAVADDQNAGPGMIYDRADGTLIPEGVRSTGKMKNLYAVVYLPFHDSISGDKRIIFAYGRTSPMGDAVYGDLPIGSEFVVITVDGTTQLATAAARYLKTAIGVNGWEKLVTSNTGLLNSKMALKALTDADNTLLVADLLGGLFTQTPTANRTLTLDTPAHIVAAIPGCIVGSSILFTVKNLTASTYSSTIAVVSGITNGGVAGDLTVAAAATASFRLVVSNATAGSEAAVLFKV